MGLILHVTFDIPFLKYPSIGNIGLWQAWQNGISSTASVADCPDTLKLIRRKALPQQHWESIG